MNPMAALACPAPPPEDAAAASIIAGGGGENGGDDGGENGGEDGDDAPGAAPTPTAVTCGQQGVPACPPAHVASSRMGSRCVSGCP